ncbi:signal peptidase I [Singulisphaera rosea]
MASEKALNGKRRRRWLLIIPALSVILWFARDAATYATSLRVYSIPSGSMGPTLAPGDRICVSLRGASAPRRQEVWVFRMPKGGEVVKRVIGLPGETIEVSSGRVWIDGKVIEEPYLKAPITYTMPPIHLQTGEYFMMGDSRNASNDSHVWGPVPDNQFVGRAEYRCWPSNRIGSLR